MNPLYPLVASRARHRCEYCRAPEAVFNFPFEVEHIIPTSQGGTGDESNLSLACRICNLRKSNHEVGWDDQTGRESRLFHPRQDRWDDHFVYHQASRMIVGLTPIGRATVDRLRLNSPGQLTARSQWTRLGVFPMF